MPHAPSNKAPGPTCKINNTKDQTIDPSEIQYRDIGRRETQPVTGYPEKGGMQGIESRTHIAAPAPSRKGHTGKQPGPMQGNQAGPGPPGHLPYQLVLTGSETKSLTCALMS
jgi:hypothetical protein